MSTLKIIDQRLTGRYLWEYGLPWPRLSVEAYDPNGRDGEWHAVVRMPHEVAEHDGYGVPLFEGDVERIAWGATRRGRRNR